MLKRIAAALFFLQLAVLPAQAQTWTWTGGGASNNWVDPQNWSPQSVPPDGADVNLLLGLPKLDTPVVIRRLRMSAGYLDGSGDVTVTERMDWTSGVLQGTGTLTLGPGASLFGSATFNGIPLTLSRRLILGGFAAPRAQHILISNGSIEIAPSGVLEIAGDAGTAAAVGRETGYSAQLTNYGTLRKISAAKATLNVPFDCGADSRIEFVEGILHLRQSGTFACKVNVPLTGSLILENSRTYAPGFELSGPGPIEIRSGTHDFPPQGINNLGPFTISGGAGLLFSDPWETDAPFTVLESSTFGTNSTATFRTLTCFGGLRGTGTMRVEDVLSLDTASISNPLTVVLEAGGTGSVRSSSIGGTLRVDGGIAVLPSDISLLHNSVPGSLKVSTGATVDLITVPETLSTVGIRYGTIENNGTIRKTGDTKSATILSEMQNLGVTEVTSGTLNLNGPFANSGTLRVLADGAVSFLSFFELSWAPHSMVEGSGSLKVTNTKIDMPGQFSHTGPITLENGRLTISNPPPLLPAPISVTQSGELGLGADTTVADLVVNNAKINVEGEVRFNRAQFTTTSWSGSGTGRFPAGSQVTINQITGANSIVNESASTIVSRLSSNTIHNAPGATFTVVSPGSTFVAFAAQLLTNDGLITIPTSTSISGVLRNNGEVRITSGVLSTSRPPTNFAAGVLTGGTWTTQSGGSFQFSDTTDPILTAIGPGTTVRLSGGNSDIGGSTGIRPLARNDGVLDISNRNKDIVPTGGSLVNAGDLRLRSNALLSVQGDLTLDPAGSLTMDFGGTSWDTSGAIKVSGTLALAGRLAAGPVPPFAPSPSNAFLAAVCGQRVGQFDELSGLNGYGPRLLFTSTNVFLRLGTCPPDLNADSVVDDEDFVIFAAAYDIAECTAPDMPSGCTADFDFSGVVDDQDFALFASRYDRVLCY